MFYTESIVKTLLINWLSLFFASIVRMGIPAEVAYFKKTLQNELPHTGDGRVVGNRGKRR